MKVAMSFFILLLMDPFMGRSPNSDQNILSISQKEINRKRAIEIARAHVKFQPKSIKAEKLKENRRPVWRVTFRGESMGQGNVMGEIMIISIDSFTGEIVSIAQS
jgi:hypothetical protein